MITNIKNIAIIAIVLSVFAVLTGTGVDQQSHASSPRQDQELVVITKKTSDATPLAKKLGLVKKRTNSLPDGRTVTTYHSPSSQATAAAMSHNSATVLVYKNRRYQTFLGANDPRFQDRSQWNLAVTSFPSGWDQSRGSSNTTIAVVDSGILSSQSWANSAECPVSSPCSQPDLPDGKQWKNLGEIGTTPNEGSSPNCTSRGLSLNKSCNNLDDDGNGFIDDHAGWDFMGGFRGSSGACPNYVDPSSDGYVYEDNSPQPYSCDDPSDPDLLNKTDTCAADMSSGACGVSHGTSVASIAGASTNNGQLIAGVDWNAKIMSLRALDGYGYGTSATISAAIEYAIAMDADVINLSFGTSSGGSCGDTDELIEASLKRAYEARILVVAAAGNYGTSTVCYPARSKYAVAVGATDQNDRRASFSSYGTSLDVVAPGQSIPVALAPTASENTLYGSVAGTSFAAPHVTGLAALVLNKNPSLSPSEVRALILLQADKPAGMNGRSYTDTYGYGRINAARTLSQTPRYLPLSKPRSMKLAYSTQRTSLIYGTKIGTSYAKGSTIRFTTKVLIRGQWYLRSEYDTSRNYHRGFPLSSLAEV